MTTIGERLRRQRIERGVDLGQVARETKISPKLLEAIEAEDFDKLPGGVFRKSFVRQYARALGIEESDIAADLDRIVPAEDLTPLAHSVTLDNDIPALPTQSSRVERQWAVTSLMSFFGVLGVMLLCAGIYTFWQNAREQTRQAAVKAAPPEQAAARQTAAPAQGTGARPTGAVADAEQKPLGPAGPGTTPGGAAITPAIAEVPKPAAAYTPPPPGRFRVDLGASEPAWVSVVADGKRVFAGTLDAAQARTFEAAEAVRVRVGNAGGLSVNLNGKSIGAIGPRGQIRIVEITPTGSQVLVPPKPDESEPEPQPTNVTQPQQPAPRPATQPAAPPDATAGRQGLIG